MKIDAKPFKTFDEQLKILDEWWNNFLDKKSENRGLVYDYIKKYNFQVCVDGCSCILLITSFLFLIDHLLSYLYNFHVLR